MSDDRAAVLAAIARSRSGTAEARAEAAARRIARPPAAPRLGFVAQAVAEGRTLADVFAEVAARAGAAVHRAATAADVAPTLRRIWAEHRLEGPLVRADDPLCAACDDLADTRTGPAVGDEKVGIARAAAAIAETGSLVLVSDAATPTTANFLPETHVVVVGAAEVVPAFEDFWTALRARPGLPRTVNLITGPSRTGDIELTLQIGVHGPRALHVVVFGDGR